ncbi:histidine kinase [Faecalispora jeddahensis]|jgi:hypothetical protein|uniref:histidine kinase n=1 Tax=Faecalispora jeddahensis TaxID=1414721 RepID=UPI001A9AF5AC|nr:histidine kinase [Faecalispora jeddahensis]
MSNRDYTIVMVLAAVIFLVGYNVLGAITSEPSSSSSYGTVMVIVFALYIVYLDKCRGKPKK